MSFGLQERQSIPLALTSSEESFNSTSLQTPNHRENSKSESLVRSGYNSKEAECPHNVFVLGIDGNPLTPTTSSKARKLMEGKQAKPIWNKFSQFGIQMLVETRKETPKIVLGCDFGTKFEGYSIISGRENNLNVMWKLPDKKKLVKKLEERRRLRRARRFRNCRRRECRFDNRSKKDFIAPSQLQIINSRLKCMNEFFKCYPIQKVAIEDVKFNHRDKKWGRNFSTIEVGKNFLYSWIRKNSHLQMFSGMDTQILRKEYGYKKSSSKNAEIFNSHCSDALAIAIGSLAGAYIQPNNFIVVDDGYRPKRRRLHDTQPSKGGIREKYSEGNYKGIRKGTICNFGQICGGIKDKTIRTYDWNNKRLSKSFNKIDWLSHKFKTNMGVSVNSPHA